jgi:hypothetical protein
MTPNDLCKRYLAALNASDLAGVQAMFTPEATVVSPLYGIVDAREFYAGLFADTRQSDTTLLNVFDAPSGGNAIALHFQYVWTLKDGNVVTFECVDVFELSEDRQRFDKLTIIYDTAPLRAEFQASRGT